MPEHPVRLTTADDLRRSRLTVFFRLLLSLPHLVWLYLWGGAAFVLAFVNWLATLTSGTPPRPIHNFLAAYVRYSTHVNAYLLLTANKFPGFTGTPGYEVDVELPPPERQNRWKTGFRLLLAYPASAINGALLGGLAYVAAFLGWFACMVRGTMPRGFRDLQAYSLRYAAQTTAYLLLVTDRYPNADSRPEGTGPEEPHPVRMAYAYDPRRSRLTVFFRGLLALPHFVWLLLWAIVVYTVALVNWFATLILGRSPRPLHRFLAAFVRYETHVFAYLFLVANPFPGFVGKEGYPTDLRVASPERQGRWGVFFRSILVFPAWLVAGSFGGALYTVGLLGWFVSLVTGRMPEGLARLGAYALRYSSQTLAYAFLVTPRYPHSGPEADGA